MNTNVFNYVVLLVIYLSVAQIARAENIIFNNENYILKHSKFSEINKGYENEYFLEKSQKNNRTKFIEVYYYPEIKNPVKFAQNADKEIEMKSDVILLKLIANKKQNKAILSFIDTVEQDGKTYFEHNIYKYEPYKQKGMIIVRYAGRVLVSDEKEAQKFAQEVKKINDDLIEQLIISPIPNLVEEEIG